jgi:hypothetical protein
MASVMFDEDTRRKLCLVSAEEGVWSELYADRQHRDSIVSDKLESLEMEARRSTLEGLQALSKFIGAGPA